MRILAFTDIHSNQESLAQLKKKAANADLIICAGDISVFGSKMKNALKDIASFGKKTLIVHGNHEDEQKLEKACKEFPNLIFLHKKFYEQEDLIFCGYGGGGFSVEDKKFEQFIPKIIEKAKGKGLVMVFHGPPFGGKIDFLPLYGNVGNKSYTGLIKKAKPVLIVCGHLHENFGVQDMIGSSVVVNPGPQGQSIRIES